MSPTSEVKPQSIARKPVRILAVSDIENSRVYDSRVKQRFSNVDLLVSCGDLPGKYLDYVISMLDVPMLYVNGNHVTSLFNEPGESKEDIHFGTDLHRQVLYIRNKDLLVAGIEGSHRYNKGPYQYTQFEMWLMVLRMVPKLIWNKVVHGRYLDVFVAHAPAWKLNDDTDLAHQGIKAFRWLIETFSPKVFVHGHIHTQPHMDARPLLHHQTCIYNACGYQLIDL